jgi:hypothetical protein
VFTVDIDSALLFIAKRQQVTIFLLIRGFICRAAASSNKSLETEHNLRFAPVVSAQLKR